MTGTTSKQGTLAASRSDMQVNYTVPLRIEPTQDPTGQNLRMLPKESGVALMGFGIVGVLLLDPFDIVFVLVGALVFTPRLFHRTELWVQARFPQIHREGRRHIDRYIDDFERRFPPNRH